MTGPEENEIRLRRTLDQLGELGELPVLNGTPAKVVLSKIAIGKSLDGYGVVVWGQRGDRSPGILWSQHFELYQRGRAERLAVRLAGAFMVPLERKDIPR